MTRPRCLRAAAFAAALFAFPAPALAEGPRVISADELTPTISKEISKLRDEIQTRLKDDPVALGKALETLDKTANEFSTRVEAVKDKTNYSVEAEYLHAAFAHFVLDPTSASIKVWRDKKSSFMEKKVKVEGINSDVKKTEWSFNAKFYASHKNEVDLVAAARLEEINPTNPGDSSGAGVTAGTHDVKTGHSASMMPVFLNHSYLIPIGTQSIAAVNSAASNTGSNPGGNTGSTPGGNTGNTGGNTTPPGTGNGGASPNGDPNNGGGGNGGQGGTSWSDVVNNNGAQSQQAISDGAGQALQSGDYGEAVSLANLSLEMNPGNKDALGVLYSAQGRTGGQAASAAAMGVARSASAFNPSGYVPGAGGAGGVAGAGGSPSASILAGAGPGAARAAGEQALSGARNAVRLKDPASALDILSKALNQDPNNPALLSMRSQVYGMLGRWEEALKDAAAGLALVPGHNNIVLLNNKARAENRLHRYSEALATANLMIATEPGGAWGYAYRAHAQAGLGNRAAMLADINRAAELDPNFRRAAADAAQLQLPSDGDIMFLFPGESRTGLKKAPAAGPGRGKSFGIVVGAGIFGGLLLALGLLSTVLAPVKDAVASVFTRVKRTSPSAGPAAATAQPASVGGNVGGLIRGQYEISRQIGAGGMGTVYEGTDRSLGRRVAIKKMRDELRLNQRDRDRFIIEAKTVASLHHPNIVDIYAIAEEGDDVYLVFEYVDGKTVHDLVQAKGRLDAGEAVRVTRAMGEALTYAHSHGVIHRDMKPSNVMLTGAGQIKVMDFGIARMAKDAMTRYSMTNTVVGTPPYMAPEQEQGVVRKESDVYSLAICAYEMLTGKLPFIGMGAGMLMNKINMSYIPPSRNIAGLPEAFDAVFLKAFQADPDQRYHTPQEFVVALSAAADGARAKAG